MHNRLKKSPDNTLQPKVQKPNKPQPQKVLSKERLERKFTIAASDGDIESVKELLKQGVDVNCRNSRKETALINSVSSDQEGAVEVFKELLKVENIDINLADEEGDTALHWAVFKKNKVAIGILLSDERTDINAKNKNLDAAISYLIFDYNDDYNNDVNKEVVEEIIDIFLQHQKLDINYLDKNGISPLWEAISAKDEKLVAKFLKIEGIDVNLGGKKISPLLNALYSGNVNIFQMLWSFKGVDRSVINEQALNWLKNNDSKSGADNEIDLKSKQEILGIIENNNPESHEEYEVLDVSTDGSSDAHSNSSGNLSFESPEEIFVESADEAEITGAKEQSLADFLA